MILAVCATGLALGACGETLKLDVLPDELWWSGTVADGSRMPLCATNVFVTPGDEQIHWVRPRDKSPDGYLVEGNVTKRK